MSDSQANLIRVHGARFRRLVGLNNSDIAKGFGLSRQQVHAILGPYKRGKPPPVPRPNASASEFAAGLRAWRIAHGITQGEAARLLATSQAQISHAESGAHRLTTEQLTKNAMRIVNAYQIQLDKLMALMDEAEEAA